MRPIEALLLLANLLMFVVLAVSRFRAAHWTWYAALVTLLVAVAQALLEGPHWQMIPAYALSVMFFPVSLLLSAKVADDMPGHSRRRRLAAGVDMGLVRLGLPSRPLC